MAELHAAGVRRGYEQFLPPDVPPGMYLDRESGLVLPKGVRLPSIGRLIAAFCLGVSLFIVTLGVGYISWGVAVWGQGQTPAQRLLGLRCWRPETGQVADREEMALRQVVGFAVGGQLLIGVWLLLFSKRHMSLGDFLAGTVVLYDPDQVLLNGPPYQPGG
jgi:uncharacterized RDD family membrane protein YckC